MNTRDLKEKRELATKLGDIMAYLSEMLHHHVPSDIREDLESSYKLTNELYSKYIKYDTKK